MASDEIAYVVLADEPAVTVAAMSMSDGAIRWTKTLTDDGEFGFSLGPTDDGVLVPYSDGDTSHLVLLDGGGGDVAWDTEVDLYDNFGQVAPGVGVVMVSEYTNGFVDLDNGELLEIGEDEPWALVGDQLARLDGSTLKIGIDPFDDSKPPDIVELPFVPTNMVDADGLLILADGDDLIGFADGAEQWRVTSPFPFEDLILASDHHVVARMGWDVAVVRFDEKSATVLPPLPVELEPHADGTVNGRVFLVGIVDATHNDAIENPLEVAVLELGDDAITEVGPSFTSSDYPWVAGRFVLTLDGDTLHARSLTDLADAGPVPSINGVTADDTVSTDEGLLVVDQARSTVSLYQAAETTGPPTTEARSTTTTSVPAAVDPAVEELTEPPPAGSASTPDTQPSSCVRTAT